MTTVSHLVHKARKEVELAETKLALAERVEQWAGSMTLKLWEHADEKGGPEGWEDNPADDLLHRVGEELDELRKAIGQGNSVSDVAGEAADVAVMTMMVADVYGKS